MQMPGCSRNRIEQKADNIFRSMLLDNHRNSFYLFGNILQPNFSDQFKKDY